MERMLNTWLRLYPLKDLLSPIAHWYGCQKPDSDSAVLPVTLSSLSPIRTPGLRRTH